MTPQFVLLLLEDSEEDIFFFRRAIARAGRDVALHCVRNGGEAKQYLLGEEKFANRLEFPMPSVVFSDLQLPGMRGLEFLEWLRRSPTLRVMPCVIYSGSANPLDVQNAYDAGVTSFIFKPLDFADWVTRLEITMKFWMDIAQRPVVDE